MLPSISMGIPPFSVLNHLKMSLFLYFLSSKSLKLSFSLGFPYVFPRFSAMFPGNARRPSLGPRLSHGARHEEIGHAHVAQRFGAAQRLGAFPGSGGVLSIILTLIYIYIYGYPPVN